jgi:ribosomal protein L7/L12
LSTATKTLIATTVKITGMSRDTLQNLLLDILSSNPTVIYTAMDVDTTPKGTLYKVVLGSPTTNKISLIKAFRNVAGAGLADSKNWSEGETYEGCDAGTFKRFLTREEADRLAAELNSIAVNSYQSNGFSQSPTGITVKVIKDSEFHDYRSLVNWTVKPCAY